MVTLHDRTMGRSMLHAIRVYANTASGHQCDVWMRGEGTQACVERMRKQSIVRIEKDGVMARDVFEAFVSRRARALVALSDAPHGPVPRRDCDRIVGGPVVDNDNLDGRVRLRQDTFDSLPEELRLVVAGDHNRDELRDR